MSNISQKLQQFDDSNLVNQLYKLNVQQVIPFEKDIEDHEEECEKMLVQYQLYQERLSKEMSEGQQKLLTQIQQQRCLNELLQQEVAELTIYKNRIDNIQNLENEYIQKQQNNFIEEIQFYEQTCKNIENQPDNIKSAQQYKKLNSHQYINKEIYIQKYYHQCQSVVHVLKNEFENWILVQNLQKPPLFESQIIRNLEYQENQQQIITSVSLDDSILLYSLQQNEIEKPVLNRYCLQEQAYMEPVNNSVLSWDNKPKEENDEENQIEDQEEIDEEKKKEIDPMDQVIALDSDEDELVEEIFCHLNTKNHLMLISKKGFFKIFKKYNNKNQQTEVLWSKFLAYHPTCIVESQLYSQMIIGCGSQCLYLLDLDQKKVSKNDKLTKLKLNANYPVTSMLAQHQSIKQNYIVLLSYTHPYLVQIYDINLQTIYVQDQKQKEQEFVYKNSQRHNNFSFYRQNKFLLGGDDGRIYIFDLDKHYKVQQLISIETSHQDPINCISYDKEKDQVISIDVKGLALKFNKFSDQFIIEN